MDKKQMLHKHSIVDVCDKIIEDAQTTLMNQTVYDNEITISLSDYTGYYCDDKDAELVNKEIIDYLISKEIRLYEDECDENGIIISSKEVTSKLFDNVTLLSSKNNNFSISLVFSKGMMDLLY